MPIWSKSEKRRRRFTIERLERRQVLSADLFGHLGPAAHVAEQAIQHFDFSITGSQVFYSPLGLPIEMKGDCYMAAPNGTSLGNIGTYDESLQPIFAPVGPGGSEAFVGATGVCTFDFDLSLPDGRSLVIGSIVTTDVAMIQGVLPNGTILVHSTSSPIVSTSGVCAGLSGTFDGQSEVVMGATFQMHTDVQFAVHASRDVNMDAVLMTLARVNDATASLPPAGNVHHYHKDHDVDVVSDAAVDSVFASTGHDAWDDILL